MPDLLDELRAANPVDPDRLKISETLAARGHRRRRYGRTPLLFSAAAALVAATLIALAHGGSPDLAARAYAATTGHGIVHWRIDITGYSKGRVGTRQRVEGWSYGGVVHTVHSDVVHGKLRTTIESRTDGRRVMLWSTATSAWSSSAAPKRPKQQPIPTGDPFVEFRRAYRAGTLRELGGGRFEVPFKHAPRGAVVYSVDPATGRPLRLTIATGTQSKTVLRVAVYQRLPVTATNRQQLNVLDHPGPGTQAPSNVFAALRTGDPPKDARFLELLAKEQPELHLDVSGARTLAGDAMLVPGKGYVCLVRGMDSSCKSIRAAAKGGIATGALDSLVVAVPDGVTSVQARRSGKWRRYSVKDGIVHLPNFRYRWRLVR
jgi:hypothetical protein